MAEEEFGSLFEGMNLVNPSQILDFPPDDAPPPLLSQPLDENLFSDLTVNPIQALDSIETPTPEIDIRRTDSQEVSSSRQISRRKKRATRIGYGRETTEHSHGDSPVDLQSKLPDSSRGLDSPTNFHPSLVTPCPLPSGSNEVEASENIIANEIEASENIIANDIEASENIIANRTDQNDGDLPEITVNDEVNREEAKCDDSPDDLVPESASNEASFVSIEEKLEMIRERISEKLEKIRVMAASVSVLRKASATKRRHANENVNLASLKYKELEKELEEACETEDFERAERVSESLAVAEKAKEELLNDLRDAELDCDRADLKMQEILELQIAAEEEGVPLLEQFAKDAADNADSVLKDAEKISSKKLAEWESLTEFLETKKMELDIESDLINDARSGLNDSIDHLIEDERNEKKHLTQKQKLLMEELDNLLALVRLKEAEIADNDSNIIVVEKRIADVVSGFHEVQLAIDTKYDDLQSALGKIASESNVLATKKKEIDDVLSLAEEKRSKLTGLASVSAEEARVCRELVGLRKSLASSVLKSREDKVRLAKTEEKISEEVQVLKQQVSAARVSLQELSSTRASIQQDTSSSKQKISFIDKRAPELEAEKKVAAAARNFKEAGRIAAEAKALSIEKEEINNKMEKATFELDKLEEEIKDTVNKLQKTEKLILSKEREAAMAGCERLRLVAAAAMSERSAALELGDLNEANILLSEADAADAEATKLQQAYNFEAEFGKISRHFIPMALITSLAGKQLTEVAASLQFEDKVIS